MDTKSDYVLGFPTSIDVTNNYDQIKSGKSSADFTEKAVLMSVH